MRLEKFITLDHQSHKRISQHKGSIFTTIFKTYLI